MTLFGKWVSSEKHERLLDQFSDKCDQVAEGKREIERVRKQLAVHEEVAASWARMSTNLSNMREDLSKSRESTNEAINKDFKRIAYEIGAMRELMTQRESHYAALTRAFESQQEKGAAVDATFSLLLRFESLAEDLVAHHLLARSRKSAKSGLTDLMSALDALIERYDLRFTGPDAVVTTVPLIGSVETEIEQGQQDAAFLPAWAGGGNANE